MAIERIPLLRVLVYGFALLMGFSTAANAATETLRWMHPSASEIAGFKVYTGPAPRSYSAPTDVGIPPISNDIYSFDIVIPEGQTTYVTITAYDSGGNESTYSDEGSFSPPAPPPPPPADPPPSNGVLFDDDLETSSLGAIPPGWYSSAKNNSMSFDGSLFSVTSLSGNHVIGTSSTQTNIHLHYTAPEADNWSNYEYRGRMLMTASTGGIGITAYSQYPNWDGYYRVKRQNQTGWTVFRMAPHLPGQQLSCSSDTTGVEPQTNRWYRFRFQILTEATQTSLRARMWEDGSQEPSNWQIDCVDTDAERLTGGRVGAWSMGGGSKYWDDLVVVELDAVLSGTDPWNQSLPLGLPAKPAFTGQ